MPKRIDISGTTYWEQLTAIKPLPGGKWLFRCKCGKEKDIDPYNVKSGNTKSCGCTRYQFDGKAENMRACIVCGLPFKPKRTDTRICYSQCCKEEYIRQKRAKARAERLTPKPCAVCEKLFIPVRTSQACCSPACNDKKQKTKRAAQNAEELASIKRQCKYKCCKVVFTPQKRRDQVFCSERCALLQGRLDWKIRNSERVKASQNRRLRYRYQNDEAYRARVQERRHSEYHALTQGEKRELSRRNRSRRNQERLKAYHRQYHANRSLTDVDFRLINLLRTRTRLAIQQGKAEKSEKTIELIGCSLAHMRLYIESLFENGMSWDNWSRDGWHLDHIRPCGSFDLQNIQQQRLCFNWRNYRPLWGSDNISKNDSYSQQDEIQWAEQMRMLGFTGNLFLVYKDTQVQPQGKADGLQHPPASV